MDPDELLKRILEECRATENGPMPDDSTIELVDSVLELHEWFMRGGYLPRMWSDRIKPRPLLPESDNP